MGNHFQWSHFDYDFNTELKGGGGKEEGGVTFNVYVVVFTIDA